MILQLKNSNANQFCQGGWPFVDPKSGFKCNGYEGTPKMHANKIIAHRRANPTLFPPNDASLFDVNSVIQEIYQQKFQTHPQLFVGQPGYTVLKMEKPAKKNYQPNSKCPKCNSPDFEPVYCPTCTGRRITGYKCKSCGTHL